MKPLFFIITLQLVITLVAPLQSMAGTLDEAPFRVVVPGKEWRVEDATAQPMGKDVFLVATISNTNAGLKSVVVRTDLHQVTASSLEELCAGMREAFTNPKVKKLSELDTSFMGYKAKTFAFIVNQGTQSTYSEATVFVTGGKGWAITCAGRADQKEAIQKMIGFYQKRSR